MTRVSQRAKMQLGGVIPDRPLQIGRILIPDHWEMRLSGDDLLWNPWFEPTEARPGAGMLAAFVNLHNSPDEAILDFSKKWGTMSFCEHNLPHLHTSCFDALKMGTKCNPIKRRTLVAEPLAFWRRLSKIAEAVLNIGSELNQDRLGRVDDWQIASVEYLHGAPASDELYAEVQERGIKWARMNLAWLITVWIRIGGPSPTMQYSEEHAQWQMVLASDYGSTFGAIGMKLMMAISERDALAICSSCHNSYTPPRRPDPTRRNYCPNCGKQAAWKDAKRQQRERERDARGK